MASDLAAIGDLIAALYEAVSFQSGHRPDFDRLRTCFAPGARLINAATQPAQVMDLDQFIAAFQAQVDADDLTSFQEHEIGRRLDVFGHIAQALSAYGCQFTAGDETQTVRGMNSIQMARLDGAWQVVSLIWDVEGPDRPLPEEFHG